MPLLEIRIAPDPILRKKARAIRRVDDAVRKLACDMIETMQDAQGVGLAANQVGVLKRLVTIQIPEEDPRVLINPEVTRREGCREVQEGCLSVPGYTGLINRSVRIRARALDEWGGKFRFSAEELLAQAIEHEIDHLNGILFLDHLESHEKLWRNDNPPPMGPHLHDVDIEVHADHSDGDDAGSAGGGAAGEKADGGAEGDDDGGDTEILAVRARLSAVTSDAGMRDLAYDLSDARAIRPGSGFVQGSRGPE